MIHSLEVTRIRVFDISDEGLYILIIVIISTIEIVDNVNLEIKVSNDW